MFALGLAFAAAGPSASVIPPPPAVHVHTRHFDVYATAGSPAAADLEAIARSREEALEAIARLFDAPPPQGIRLTLFPDERTKKNATGHSGLGWAEGKVMEEVYNRDVRLDPYHELVHVVGAPVGHPPAFLDEGFAVYVAERLGADALALLGFPGTTIRAAGCQLVSQRQALPLEQLFDFTELGSPESQGPISYPQSASVVKYLIDTYGLPPFRLAYRRLRGSSLPEVRSANRSDFTRLYGKSPAQIESDWIGSVCGATPGPSLPTAESRSSAEARLVQGS